ADVGTLPEVTDTLRVLPFESTSVAPVGRPARSSLSGRKTTVAWGLSVVTTASLAAIAASVALRPTATPESFGSSRVPALPVSSAPRKEIDLAPPAIQEAPVQAPSVTPAAPTRDSAPVVSATRPVLREATKKT